MKELKKKQMLKKVIVYLSTLLVAVGYLIFGNHVATRNLSVFTADTLEVMKVRVDVVLQPITEEVVLDEKTTLYLQDIPFSATILSGESKGKTITALQSLGGLGDADVKAVEIGDKVLVTPAELEETGYSYAFTDYLRMDTLIILALIFFGLVLLFGHIKGFNTLLALLLTCTSIFAVFIPAILSGYNIYFWSVITCLFTVLVSFMIIYGLDRKSMVAIIGCVGGVSVAALLTLLMNEALQITGMIDDEALYLSELIEGNPIDLKAIIFAAILIGALGAMMDIAMSMASSLWEIRQTAAVPSIQQLMKSGLAIGRDLMGININTLMLAYIGSSLSVVLLLIAYNHSLTELLNREMIVVEILQALAGSLGILFTIPLTALFASLLYIKKPDSVNG